MLLPSYKSNISSVYKKGLRKWESKSREAMLTFSYISIPFLCIQDHSVFSNASDLSFPSQSRWTSLPGTSKWTHVIPRFTPALDTVRELQVGLPTSLLVVIKFIVPVGNIKHKFDLVDLLKGLEWLLISWRLNTSCRPSSHFPLYYLLHKTWYHPECTPSYWPTPFCSLDFTLLHTFPVNCPPRNLLCFRDPGSQWFQAPITSQLLFAVSLNLLCCVVIICFPNNPGTRAHSYFSPMFFLSLVQC